MPFISTALALGGLAAAGSLGGAAIASSGANKAANTQASAADQAALLQAQESQQAIDFQKQQYNTQQQQLAPWLSAGTQAIGQLSNQTLNGGVPGFQAPTDVTEQNDPGFQFRLQQGQQAIQNSAAARGGLLSGATAKALDAYSQGQASNEYQNVYNRALTDYNTNTIGSYNRLASLAGIGQQAQATGAQQGQSAANNITNTLLTAGQQQSQDIQNAAAARASGYSQTGQYFGNAASGFGSNIGQSILLSQLMNPSTGNYGSGTGQTNPESYPANYPYNVG